MIWAPAIARRIRGGHELASKAGSETSGRSLPLRRRGSDVEAGERRDAAVGPRMVLRPDQRRPGQSGQSVCHQHCDVYDADAGKTWAPVKGAPGGDDYHQLWVNPQDGHRMVLCSDQGTVVRVDGGKTWSTWYNQPTAQIYHVAADNRFPYWLYGAQQDSAGRCGSARGRAWALWTSATGSPSVWRARATRWCRIPTEGNLLYGAGDGRCNQALNFPAPLGGELPAADPTIPTAGHGLCRRCFRRPMGRSTIRINLFFARGIGARRGRRSVPI